MRFLPPFRSPAKSEAQTPARPYAQSHPPELRPANRHRTGLFAAAVFTLALPFSSPLLPVIHAQTAQTSGRPALEALIEKARALEARGRTDIASQTWQQVLLADPNNPEALAGLARAAKLSGNYAVSNSFLERLRAVNPKDPAIQRIENLSAQQDQNAALQQAGKYAQAGQYAQAMAIYRKAFGNNPPPGEPALAFYETEAATDTGRPHALEELRALAARYPADPRYSITLGRILTYNPKTRAEGRRLLDRHPDSPQAVAALRQSLLWDSANPAATPDIRAYLARHADPDLAEALRKLPATRAPLPGDSPETLSSRARGVETEQAYRSLNSKDLSAAEQRFQSILTADPENARALAGLGYIRMQQSNFAAALSFLDQAKQNGARDPGLDTAINTSRFWFTMGQGSDALAGNDLPSAEQHFRAALNLRPNSPEALEGLGGTLLKAQQFDPAVAIYERFARAKPNSPAAWRGLLLAHAGAGNAQQALLTERRIPPSVRAQLMRDPDYLRTLASAYSATGRDADAQRTLRSALDLPFPAGANGLKVETQIQYAGLLQQANHLDQAAGLYRQVLASDPTNTGAWEGLIRVEHAGHQDPLAVQTLTSMPPSMYESSMRDPGFQATVAAIYQAVNRLDTAQDILERSVAETAGQNQKPSVALELQLAGIYLARNNSQRAFPIYRQILSEDPNRIDAWKGLLSTLHSSGRDGEALSQAQQIPPAVRRQLEDDVEYLQTMGAVYNGLGQPAQSMVFLHRVQQHYELQHSAPPADIDIQDAWLLFNSGNDIGLYRELMRLGSRADLSDEQRRTVQTIWTNWAVRRSNQAAAAGDLKRSLDILNAAAKAFPDNPGVLRALASGYARAGIPKQAVLIFKSQDMTAASSSDYKSAIGAALAANDLKSAETWLRYGLDSYPKDAAMLNLGARFEQARGNQGRAADYFRASLAALPPTDPGAELASELGRPAPAVRLPSATQSQDLATLLSTGGDGRPDIQQPTAQSAPEPARPYLPTYGNLSGEAPVQFNPTPTSSTRDVVPSYMGNPAPGGRATSTQPANRQSTLKDYVPQPATTPPSYTPAPPRSSNTLTYPSPQISGTPNAGVQPKSASEIYGPYVPYIPRTENAGFAPSPVPVQLGDNSPRTDPQGREITDVLPTARYVPNAPSRQSSAANRSGVSHPPPDTYSTTNTQYKSSPSTPSNGNTYGQQYPQPDIQPTQPGSTSSRRITRHRSASSLPSTTSTTSSTPSAAAPPLTYPAVAPPLSSEAYPPLRPAANSTDSTPPTDADLAAKNVPPLRGPFDRSAGVVPGVRLSQREQTELDLASLEASYSGWIGGAGSARYRSGTSGFDRLIDIEAPIEASAVLGKKVRVTVVPRPVFLSSGVVDTAAAQAAAQNAPNATPPVLGTLPANAVVSPAQQFSSGIGGELQLTSANLGFALGYTPYEFLVSNITGRFQWRPGGSHLLLFGDRDSVKDTELSYAGLRDPGSITPVFSGNIWGGVISTTGGARLDFGTDRAGLYLSGDGGALTGYHVLQNQKYEGSLGAYFRVKRWPGYGALNVGGSLFGQHYTANERGLSYGQGGYFSPNVYFLASVPVTFNGLYKKDLHYTINANIGVQTFQEAAAVFYPLDLARQSFSNPTYPLNSNTGLNYALNSEASYRIADHWYVGGFVSANNSNNYNTASGGFFLRYLFKQQVTTEDHPTGLFPVTGFRPLRVP